MKTSTIMEDIVKHNIHETWAMRLQVRAASDEYEFALCLNLKWVWGGTLRHSGKAAKLTSVITMRSKIIIIALSPRE